MTVSELTKKLTIEELVGWAAFFEIKNEQEEKMRSNPKSARVQR
tara:strand:- start:950 stop:1081 length:132 start_codon:yes stop_codon:yes gene_type:complete